MANPHREVARPRPSPTTFAFTFTFAATLLTLTPGLAPELILKTATREDKPKALRGPEEQAHVPREVDRNLVNIQNLSAQTAAGANQTNSSSQKLYHLALSFNAMVGKLAL